MEKICSVIVSVYNEEDSLEQFYQHCSQSCEKLQELGYGYEIVFVNDGSQDKSAILLEDFAERDREHVRVLSFSRNFGHEAAMTAGLDHAKGDFLVFMDADLQHPPELISEMLKKSEEGYQVVSMVRTKNPSAGLVKNITSALFYWILNHVSPVHFEENASDFFGISKKVQEVLKKHYREKVRYLRGFVQSVGFPKTSIRYEAAARQAVHSHYSLSKLWQFQKHPLYLFQSALTARNFCSHLQWRTGNPAFDLHPFNQKGRPLRLCHHRGGALLYVCGALFCHRNYLRIYRYFV